MLQCAIYVILFFIWRRTYWKILGITKPSTQLHPAPSTSTQFISNSTELHPPPPSSFQPPPSFLQHPQQYLHQNVARNWAISPNFGQKIKSLPFWLKIGTHGILEVLIPNPDLKFRSQNSFLGKFGPKKSKLSVLSENWCTEYFKDADSYSNISFLNFKIWIPFSANLGQKSQSCLFCLKVCIMVSRGSWFLFQHLFS